MAESHNVHWVAQPTHNSPEVDVRVFPASQGTSQLPELFTASSSVLQEVHVAALPEHVLQLGSHNWHDESS